MTHIQLLNNNNWNVNIQIFWLTCYYNSNTGKEGEDSKALHLLAEMHVEVFSQLSLCPLQKQSCYWMKMQVLWQFMLHEHLKYFYKTGSGHAHGEFNPSGTPSQGNFPLTIVTWFVSTFVSSIFVMQFCGLILEQQEAKIHMCHL